MIYLLDTDTLIFLVRGLKHERIKSRHRQALRIEQTCRQRAAQGDDIGLSAITVAELEYGARRSRDYDEEIRAVQKILTPFRLWDFDATGAAEQYGRIRQELESAGAVIGAMDLLIAAHARALGAVLVTNNAAHFRRVKDLPCENWSA